MGGMVPPNLKTKEGKTMRKIILSTVCGVALISGNAVADEGSWYAGIDGSYSILGKEKAKGSPLDLQSHFNDGWALGGTMGYDFGVWRLEGEIGKHFHNADRFAITNDGGLGLGGGSVNATTGKSRLTHYMVNAVYDFAALSDDNKVEPFIGAGLGLGDLNMKNLATAGGAFAHDKDSVFAYQMFAGVRVPLANAFEMSLKYRFLGTADASLQDNLGNRFKASYGVHDIMMGVTYRFGGSSKRAAAEMPQPIEVAAAPEIKEEIVPEPVVEEPVQAPDPMPEPAAGPEVDMGPYVVYFDWNSKAITAQAQDIISKAASEAGKLKEIEIKVVGHADRSGLDSYNDKLSLARAAVVKQALIDAGVDAGVITMESFGETAGEVVTEDGVREARNRRVLITLK
jgi:outer membrane protein OmpA-like peptidoglycan-associated protein|tara:strand:+ start:819 stop:2015 length:1197 start_codon:yes stop_codon:yes gene_type:complete